jgi:hypothetical protein
MPAWLWGGKPKGLLTESGYHFGTDRSGNFFVEPNERYLRRRPDLVRLRTIAGPGEPAPRWRELARLNERVEAPKPNALPSALERRRQKAEQGGALVDTINYQRLLLSVLPVEDLPLQARYFVEYLNALRFEEDPANGPFANTSVQLIETDPILVHRLKMASVFLRIEHDPRLSGGDTAHIKTLLASGESVFAASAGLHDGVMLFDAYLTPLLAAGSPGVWAINVVRSFGSLVFTLGTFVSGTDGDASELLQLLALPGASEAVKFPRLSTAAASDALEWWTERLNLLFGVLSDLATFTDRAGTYRPAKHLEALLTVEQVFRRTASMLVAHRDTHARRALLFTVLDSMEGLRGTSLLTMCALSHASKTLAALEQSMPKAAAEVLLPAARRAVEALKGLQEGFFIRRQLGTTDVELLLPEGNTQSLSPDDAVARYLKLLRDATHGHSANKQSVTALTEALLANHDGAVPHDVGLLGYLYLLDVLANPDRLRRTLFRGGR